MAAFLERLKKRQDLAFHYRFIEMTCFIGGQLLQATDPENWENELRRFAFAAFFCDITLSQPKYLHIFAEEDMKDLRPHEIKEVHEHALKAAQMVAKIPTAPIDIGIVIKQHHGSLTGIGFAAKKPSNLTSLAKCLIISHELAHGILTNSEKPALEVLKALIKIDRGAALQELVDVFEKSLRPELVPL